jgi:hypothetical protein
MGSRPQNGLIGVTVAALARFLDYVQRHVNVWCCRRIDIAQHWHAHH